VNNQEACGFIDLNCMVGHTLDVFDLTRRNVGLFWPVILVFCCCYFCSWNRLFSLGNYDGETW